MAARGQLRQRPRRRPPPRAEDTRLHRPRYHDAAYNEIWIEVVRIARNLHAAARLTSSGHPATIT